MNTQNTVISDPGIDDMIALALLEALTHGKQQTLVPTFGNAPEAVTSVNANEFVRHVAPSWGVARGAALPISGAVEHPWPDYFHGPDGVWGIHVGITSSVPVGRGEIFPDIISLAPMTQICRMQRSGQVASATVMGGAFRILGNETKYAETNIAFDPDAAAEFFASSRKQAVKVVPLDVTRKVYWSKRKAQSIPETSFKNIWLKRMLCAWFDKYNHDKEKEFNLHDPLAVYLTFFPDMAVWESSGVCIKTDGEQRGQTVLDTRSPTCFVALDLMNPKKIARDIFASVFLGAHSMEER